MAEINEPVSTEINGSTFTRTCFNGMNTLLGIGLLSIAFALSKGGWLSLIALVISSSICFYTACLLRKCMDSNPAIKTYLDIVEVALGRKAKAKIFVSIFMYFELFLVSIDFLILGGDNLHKLFPHTHISVLGKSIGGSKIFILVTAIVVLPTTWLRDLSVLSYVSAGGVLMSYILIATVIWIGAFENVGFRKKGILWSYSGMPTAISLYTVCYVCHPVLPTLRSSMRDQRQFPKVLLVCFIFSFFSYGLLAVVGYLMYGVDMMSQITLNLPVQNISSKIAICTTLLNPITKYALIISPIATAIEERFALNNNRAFSLLIRTGLVVSSALVALVVPFFGYVLAFIGAFLGVAMSILVPCACYWKIIKPPAHEIVIIGVIIVYALIVASTGTYSSIRNIIKG